MEEPEFESLFPTSYAENQLGHYCDEITAELANQTEGQDLPKFPGECTKDRQKELIAEYSRFPEKPGNPIDVIRKMARDLFVGAVNWRSPQLQYNVGSPANLAASALSAVAMDANIFSINSGLAGNALAAEKAVVNLLESLAGVDAGTSHGLFTFGGTATNLYSLKLAINSLVPNVKTDGVPGNLRIFITQDAHFSHGVAANWLGIGTRSITEMKANGDRSTYVAGLEVEMRRAVERGERIVSIIANGGTTYDHAIDDIPSLVDLRGRVVSKYGLDYLPHIHVDSVIGWEWLFFQDYDFESNPLGIPPQVLTIIQRQYEKIRHIKLADSWGVDLHKGIGGCPIPSSVFMVNDKQMLRHLSKRSDCDIHQLAHEFSFDSPVDYTLETSRPASAPLAALAALHTLGKAGYQTMLANLIESMLHIRELIDASGGHIRCSNALSLGYVTMARIYPPEMIGSVSADIELGHHEQVPVEFTQHVNRYNKSFFTWDNATRMKDGKTALYSFSSEYITLHNGVKIPAIKFYPTSPHTRPKHSAEMVEQVMYQKKIFDEKMWPSQLAASNSKTA